MAIRAFACLSFPAQELVALPRRKQRELKALFLEFVLLQKKKALKRENIRSMSSVDSLPYFFVFLHIERKVNNRKIPNKDERIGTRQKKKLLNEWENIRCLLTGYVIENCLHGGAFKMMRHHWWSFDWICNCSWH